MLYCILITDYEYECEDIYHIKSDKSPKEAFFEFMKLAGKEIKEIRISNFTINTESPYFLEDDNNDPDHDWYTCEDECFGAFIYPVKAINL